MKVKDLSKVRKDKRKKDRQIVVHDHPSESDGPGISEVELALVAAYHGFTRWIESSLGVAGYPGMGALEFLALSIINHHERDKRLADIGFLLNVDDSHKVNYALRKLLKAEMIRSERRGKEVFYSASPKGLALLMIFRENRAQEFSPVQSRDFLQGTSSTFVADLQRLLSHFDQASRALTAR